MFWFNLKQILQKSRMNKIYNYALLTIFTVKLVSLISLKYLAYIRLDKTEVNSRALKGLRKFKKGPRNQGFLGPFWFRSFYMFWFNLKQILQKSRMNKIYNYALLTIFTVKLVSLISLKYLAYIRLDKTEVNSRALKGLDASKI